MSSHQCRCVKMNSTINAKSHVELLVIAHLMPVELLQTPINFAAHQTRESRIRIVMFDDVSRV